MPPVKVHQATQGLDTPCLFYNCSLEDFREKEKNQAKLGILLGYKPSRFKTFAFIASLPFIKNAELARMKKTALLSGLLLLLFSCGAPVLHLKPIAQAEKFHIRGLDFSPDGTLWASGTDGSVLRSVDEGASWNYFQIPGAETLDFRDVEAFSSDEAMVLSAGSPARIYHTVDAGETWSLVYENKHPDIFLDGMDFNEAKQGVAYGDPVDSNFALLFYIDGKWDTIAHTLPTPLEGEAGFAASGTGVICEGNNIWIATGGGLMARVFVGTFTNPTFHPILLPMPSGEGRGIFSIAKNGDNMVAVGGAYLDSTNIKGTAVLSKNGGASWKKSLRPAFGYRSCAVALPFDGDKTFVACGRTGIDYTRDGGITWQLLSTAGGYFTAASYGTKVFFAGRYGKVAMIDFAQLEALK